MEVRLNVAALAPLLVPLLAPLLAGLQACAQAPSTPPSPAATKPAPDLRHTDWQLVELDGAAAPAAPQQPVRLALAAEGARVAGFGGCNRFSGGYTLDGAALRFAPLAATRMACDPAAMDLEGRVFRMLGAVTAYRIEGDRLVLLSADRALARFEPAASPTPR